MYVLIIVMGNTERQYLFPRPEYDGLKSRGRYKNIVVLGVNYDPNKLIIYNLIHFLYWMTHYTFSSHL